MAKNDPSKLPPSTSAPTAHSTPAGGGSARGVQLKAALRGHDYATQVQMLSPDGPGGDVHAAAARGISGSGGALPHKDKIQQSFVGYDISNVTAHTDSAAAHGASAMGADAYATGNRVVLGKGGGDLHTVAHETAHVVQQRAGVSLSGGVGKSGDRYEQNANAVADAVVAGQSAEGLLGEVTAGGSDSAIQKAEAPSAAAPAPETRPKAGRRKVGAISGGKLEVFPEAKTASTPSGPEVQKKEIQVGTATVRIDDLDEGVEERAKQLQRIATSVADSQAAVATILQMLRAGPKAGAALQARLAKWFGLPYEDCTIYWLCVGALVAPFERISKALNTYLPIELEDEGNGVSLGYVLGTPWSDVHLNSQWFSQRPTVRALTLIHESAHKYLGVPDIQVYDYRHTGINSNKDYFALKFYEHADNADSYGLLALDGV